MSSYEFPRWPSDLGYPELNHQFENGREARRLGLPKSTTNDVEHNYREYRAYELGWYFEMTEQDFWDLQAEVERLERAAAQGQDLPWHKKRLELIDEIVAAGPWQLDMDSGAVVHKADAERVAPRVKG